MNISDAPATPHHVFQSEGFFITIPNPDTSGINRINVINNLDSNTDML